MIGRLLILIVPTFIICQTVINSQSKDFCPDQAGTKNRMPRIQIRSVLVRCPNKGEFHVVKAGVDENTNLSIIRTQDLLEFFGYDTDEPLLHSEVTNCRRKLVVTIQLANCGKTKSEEEFILIDQVYDPIWKQRIRLLNPMVFKIKQHQVEQAFGLNIQHIVNAEATEEVLNKNNKTFRGCSTRGFNPTCGYTYYRDELIPYSEGFCCSCDPYVNIRRQPDDLRTPPISPIAYTSREGQFPQGFMPKEKHQPREKSNIQKRRKRSLKESVDEIYLNFASKIKSYMIPADKKVIEVTEPPQQSELENLRVERSLFRLSPKYYNTPPLNPARGFKISDVQGHTRIDSDPWAISTQLNETEKNQRKNQSCTTYNRILRRNYFPSANRRNKLRKLEWDPIILEELMKGNIELNDRFTAADQFRKQFGNMERKRHTGTHYFDPSMTDYQFAKQLRLKRPLFNKEESAHEYQVKKLKGSSDCWISELINPYLDVGVLNSYNESRFGNCQLNISTESPDIFNNNTNNNNNNILSRTQKPNLKKMFKKRMRPHNRIKRQITSSGSQVRGGQSCVDRHTPPNADPDTYHESAHCLRFSELWYNVYRLKTPFVTHSSDFQLFEKHSFEAGNSHWEELSRGMRVHLGTFYRHIVNRKRDPTLVFTYTPLTDLVKDEFCLDPLVTTLLVPRPVSKSIEQKFPQVNGGPREYLLVRTEDITFDGEECDKAGVSYRAFAKQDSRCNNVRGTCLNNQPLQLWRQDREAKLQGKPGKYFLENYAKIADEPVKYHKDVGDFLSLDFDGSYQSVVEVEVPIDQNGLVRAESSAQLSEIYVDSTCEHQTRITILVTNTGLTSSAFYPRLKGCPPEIPQIWTENEGPLVYIAPQKVHRYRLSLYGGLPVTRFHCSVEVMNKKKELVATRRIRIQNFDRCICMWHCLCACIGSISGLKCNHMSLEHYHAAGFSGALPVDTEDPAYEVGEQTNVFQTFVLKDFLLYLGQLSFMLFLLGILKLFLGFCFTSVSNYGMWLLFETEAKQMTKYRECYWQLTHLVRDAQCFPVSPASRSRQIQILSKTGQGFVNIFFFFLLPGVVLLKLPFAICTNCCMSCLLIKMQMMKIAICRSCCNLLFCRMVFRFCRRLKKVWETNFWLPLCCFWNPFFLYSLCKARPHCDGDSKKQTKKRICKMHRLPKRSKKIDITIRKQDAKRRTTAAYLNYMVEQTQRDKFNIGRKGSEKDSLIPPTFSSKNMKQKRILPGEQNENETEPRSHVVKINDYPNLDKKAIKYIVKNVRKCFSNVMSQVINTYKTEKHKKETQILFSDVQEMKNKMMRHLIAKITKFAINELLRRKYKITERAELETANVPMREIADQMMSLIDRCFKELIKKKMAATKLTKLSDNLSANYAGVQKSEIEKRRTHCPASRMSVFK